MYELFYHSPKLQKLKVDEPLITKGLTLIAFAYGSKKPVTILVKLKVELKTYEH